MDITTERITISAYLAGGRPARNLKEAQYVVEKYSDKNQIPPDWRLLDTIELEKRKYRIWKKKSR